MFSAQSVGPREKCTEIVEFIRDEDVDMTFLTETWMKTQCDEAKYADLSSPGYTFKSFLRANRGGGLAVVMREGLPVTVSASFPFAHASFELVQVPLTVPQHVHFF